ncbi:Methyltransferase domain-containing protein [Cladophialophora immunda]|nr:Methyltransferase domain-containing protein [Cladophialophora immunda]
MDAATIYQAVNTKYSEVASHAEEVRAQASKSTRIAASFGYSAEDLASLPTGTNLGFSCGNPLATANLQPAENMVDLGSGGGLDCLIAAKQMLTGSPSPSGKIYGVDRSEAMIALATKNAAKANLPEGLVEFIQAPISDIPLRDSTIDLVVSNCVINLVPDEDKPIVFKEIHRLLKPGGRVAISDLLAKKPMPEHIRRDAALLVGCVAGASLVEEYRRWMEEAGFQKDSIAFINTEKDLNVYHDGDGTAPCCIEDTESKSCCDKSTDSGCCVEKNGSKPCCTTNGEPDNKMDFNEWVASYQIYAIK